MACSLQNIRPLSVHNLYTEYPVTISNYLKQRYSSVGSSDLRYDISQGQHLFSFALVLNNYLDPLTMARYTTFFMTGSPKDDVHQELLSALETCGLELAYQDPVYIVAKEKPGQVSFAQLTTTELMLNPPTVESGGAKIDLVVKNEELPLRQQNHCHEIFTQVKQAISEATVPENAVAS